MFFALLSPNTVADHLRVPSDALVQVPGASTAKILIRVDGACVTHGLNDNLRALNTTRRMVRFTICWTITEEDEKAIGRLPDTAWETSLTQDGLQEGYHVTELAGLNTRATWNPGTAAVTREDPAYSHDQRRPAAALPFRRAAA